MPRKLTAERKIKELQNQDPTALLQKEVSSLKGLAETAQFKNEVLLERLAELELTMEDRGWMRMAGQSSLEFSREGLKLINRLARIMYLKNPLIQRGVNVQAYYVFGQGMYISAPDDAINKVIQDFLDDPKNRAELTGQQAMTMKEKELQLFGNIYLVFFSNIATGKVLMRSIPPDEVDDIITNPEDRKDPWYYKRSWTQDDFDMETGTTSQNTKIAYYPDWRHDPVDKSQKIGGIDIQWDQPVYHVKVGGLSDMKFGMSEVYAALDWAKAYKEFLEDWATITRAYTRFAFQVTAKGGAVGRAAAKAKLNTTQSDTNQETNPPPAAGAYFISDPDQSISPIRTAGATVSPADGRRMLLMVAAVAGLPETFYGDATAGTLATAKSLDRPTELKMKDRQTLWSDIFINILLYVISKSARAVDSELFNQVQVADAGEGVFKLTQKNGSDISVKAEFPPILEHDVTSSVNAIVQAATLNSYTPAGTMDPQTTSRLLLNALGVPDVDGVMKVLFPEGIDTKTAVTTTQEAAMLEVVRDFKTVLATFMEKYNVPAAV
jgi:hypothetical protein